MGLKDELIIGATWYTPTLNAGEVIELLKEFIVKVEAISPWTRPFDVSGPSRKLACMPIDNSLSDFDAVVLKALDSPYERFFTPGDEMRKSINPLAASMSGMSATFSDSIQREGVGTIGSDLRVSISFRIGAIREGEQSGMSIAIRDYEPGQVDEQWSKSEVVEGILDLMISSFNPICASAWSANHDKEITDFPNDIYNMNWMSYTKKAAIMKVLKEFPQTRDYGQGVMVKLGDDVSTVSDPLAKKQAMLIRDRLTEAGCRDWYSR